MTMKMKAQKDDALNVATIHLLAMRIETIATTHYFRKRQELKPILAVLRESIHQFDRFNIAGSECDPVECDPWVCCRGVCEIDCTNEPDSARAAKPKRSRGKA